MKRAVIRPARGFPEDVQKKIAAEAGATVFYVKDPDSAVKAMRPHLEGGVLGVIGYRSLHSSKAEVLRLLKELHAKGCAAQDCATGRRSDSHHANDLMAEYDKEMRHERMGGSGLLKAAAKKGGLAKAKNTKYKRTPTDVAKRIWQDKSISRDIDAIEQINSFGYSMDWGVGSLRNQFGASGRKRGRRYDN